MVTKNVVTPLPYLCELTIKLINILENIHSKGVIHRDLKPQNIMLQGDSIYLIDFGISEIILNNTVKKRAFVGICLITQELQDMLVLQPIKDTHKHLLMKLNHLCT